MAVRGYLDWPRGLELVGWAYDPARPGERLRVEIRMDGEPLRVRTASSYRADLPGVGIGDGFHAFSIELPAAAFDGRPHVFEAVVAGSVVAGSGEALAISSGDALAISPGEALNEVRYQAVYFGEIVSVSASMVRIRLGDSSRPDAAVEGELYADGRLVARGYPPGLRLPAGFLVDRVRRFELRAAGCDFAVAEIAAPASPPPVPALPPGEGAAICIVVHAPAEACTATLRTLESIAAAGNETAASVHVVLERDDDPALLSTLAEAQLRQDFRIGPPALDGRDSVHLAAGSLVSANWLDRLRAAAHARPDVATASPLTGGPVDGQSAAGLDRLCVELQSQGLAEIVEPSPVCHYRRNGGGSTHLLAGGVRVESLGEIPVLLEDRHHEAHRLRRTLAEKLARRGEPAKVSAERGEIVTVDNWRYRLPEDGGALAKALRFVTVDSVLWPLEIPLPYEVDVKDYGWICPRGDLIDETGRYCGEPAIEACERCFRKLGPREGWGSLLHRCASVAELREQSRRTLEGAALVRFPSRDAADRIGRYAALSRVAVEAGELPRCPPKPALNAPERLRIALAGPTGAAWDACALDARKRALPLSFALDGEPPQVVFFASESPALQAPPHGDAYPVRFDVGCGGPGLRIPAGLPAARINDLLMREFFPGLKRAEGLVEP